MRLIALIAMAVTFFSATTRSELSPAPSDQTVSLPLHPYFKGLRTVRLETKLGSLTFLLDTGGGVTLITPEIAARAGCTPYGRDVEHRMSGEPVEFKRCDAWDLRTTGWHARIDPVGVFDVNALLPAQLPRLDGVLALDAFRGQVITLDWPSSRLQVHRDAEANRLARTRALPFRTATGDTGRILEAFVPIEATRGRLWFSLDSGNIRGTLVSRKTIDAGLLSLAADGTATLVIGGRHSIEIPVTVDDLAIDGNLGTDFLMRGAVTLDLRRVTP